MSEGYGKVEGHGEEKGNVEGERGDRDLLWGCDGIFDGKIRAFCFIGQLFGCHAVSDNISSEYVSGGQKKPLKQRILCVHRHSRRNA